MGKFKKISNNINRRFGSAKKVITNIRKDQKDFNKRPTIGSKISQKVGKRIKKNKKMANRIRGNIKGYFELEQRQLKRVV